MVKKWEDLKSKLSQALNKKDMTLVGDLQEKIKQLKKDLEDHYQNYHGEILKLKGYNPK
jgi:hypothetical protein